MSQAEVYFWGVCTGIAFYQAAMNTLDIIRMRRKRKAADGVTEVHTDHPLRHYDRTCPACNAGVEGKTK